MAETYIHNYPRTNFQTCDIAELDFDSLPAVDVLHAGFPCQSFSAAGNRKGFDDDRGRLFLTMMAKIATMQNRPKALVFENSPYLKVGASGSWFSEVVFQIRKAGYRFGPANCFEIDAREQGGSPQSRKRLFMIASRKDLGSFNPFLGLEFTNPKADLESLLDRNKGTDARYFLDPENKYSRMIMKHASSDEDLRILQLRKTIVRTQAPGHCPTLTANMGGGGHNVPFIIDQKKVRKLTERECLRLQTFPEDFNFPDSIPSSARYRMIGNAVCVQVSKGIAEFVQRKLHGVENDSVDFSTK